jgi:hypothetical protein
MSQYALGLDTGDRDQQPVRGPGQSAVLLFLLMPGFFLLVYDGFLWFTNYSLTEYCEQRPDIYDCGPVWPLLWRLGGEMFLALLATVLAQVRLRRVRFAVAIVLQLLAIGLLAHVMATFMAPNPFEQFQGNLF